MTTHSARSIAAAIAGELQANGFTAWFAGGCVRDELLGLQPKDYDIATTATPEQVASIFPGAHPVGAAFGVMLVRRQRVTIEIATFREEGAYSDHRRPDTVQFSSAERDAHRRDFTINGLFRDPVTGEVHDYVGGKKDLEAGVLRAIGNPDARLDEDHLRMLRAVRFVASLDVDLDADTKEAISRHAASLQGISRERIGDEIRRILRAPGRCRGITMLAELGLAKAIFGDVPPSEEPVRLAAVGHAGGEISALLAAWAVDWNDDLTDPDAESRRYRKALLLSNEEQHGMCACLRTYLRFETWSGLSVSAQKRLASSPWSGAALIMRGASESAPTAAIRGDIEKLSETGLSPPRILDGDTLLADGLKPGPQFGTVLEAVYDAQLEGAIEDLPAALRLARTLSGRSPSE